MITEKKVLSSDIFEPPFDLSPEETVYFDIETTGFSADVTALYLIGCIYYENGKYCLIQWFAEDNKSEKEAIITFNNFLKDKKYLICYNGITFDLPYLKKKFEKHGLRFDTDNFTIIDLYRVFSSFKNLLGINRFKQKDIENYLSIARDDKYSGGELIKWYAMYLRLRYGETAEKEEIYHTLLLHNSDDLIGMARLTCLYNFLQKINQLINSDCMLDISFETDKSINKIFFTTIVEHRLAKNFNLYKDDCNLEIKPIDNQIKIMLSLKTFDSELKLFYKDYKNYFYLPKEDIIIHKNLAAFVDKENKEKATASNCYTKHQATFIKVPKQLILPMFKTDYADKSFYTPLDNSLLDSKENLNLIFKSFLKFLVS
ncbi:MAG: ribonuclease H-like domain-containing protein [Catonella sp.]|uniref:ribonuclease H-like domain-containing protein n=1 Tax=Catonella sp. TaxID=2382125 RepID=UPI003FA08588